VDGVHDMGGQHGHGHVDVEKNEPVFHEAWEGRVRSIANRLMQAGLFNLDEFRHAQERLPPVQYLNSSYYERWLAAVELLVKETNASVSRNDLPETKNEARFKPGDRVRTKNIHPHGHTRLARYVRDKSGRVESVHGPFKLPDTNAHNRGHDWEPVYTVVFPAPELWGEDAEPGETMSIDLWQSYLEKEQ
jgi:nitrile hydratase